MAQSFDTVIDEGKLMKIEQTTVKLNIDKKLDLKDAQAVRGFFGRMYANRPEFHGHKGMELIYKHPNIQYKVISDCIHLIGMKDGAYLLKSLPSLDHLELHDKKYSIVEQSINSINLDFGITKTHLLYMFVTPWLGLNEENYIRYIDAKKRPSNVLDMLEKILIGNILSMCKSFGYVVDEKLTVSANLLESDRISIKKNLELMTFYGNFSINFCIPDLWGIGKFSSRGYGSVQRRGSVND